MRERTPPVREIAWRDVCPWLLMFEAAGAAFEVRKTLIATVGLGLTLLGWYVIGLPFGEAAAASTSLDQHAAVGPAANWIGSASPLIESWQRLTSPFQRFVVGNLSWGEFTHSALCAAWGLAVWAFFAGVLVRMSAMQLGREEPASVKEGIAHARKKYWDYATVPLIPLGGSLLMLLAVAAGGWLLRSDVGAMIAGLLAGPALLLGWFAALLTAAVLVGWPVMWSAIGVDRCDNFGAFSTTYSFITQRPVHTVLYVALASAIGAVLTFIVVALASLAVSLTFWAAGLTGGAETIASLQTALPPSASQWTFALGGLPMPHGQTEISPTAVAMIAFWCQLFGVAVAGFGLNYLFTSATALYLVLRYDVDRTEFDQVDVDKPAKVERVPAAPPPPAGLPIVQLDAKRPS